MLTLNVRRLLQVLLGATAGLLAWPIMEALIRVQSSFPDYLVFTAASGAAFGLAFGAVLGSAEGIAAASSRRVAIGSLWGALAGMLGGAAGFIAGQWVLFAAGEYLSGAVALPLARAAGWATLGVFIGMASGLRSGSLRKCGVGALGGLTGGLVGGLAIEYGLILFPASSVMRAAGLVLFGVLLGLFFAIIERQLSFGVLRVLNGELKGREYLLNQRSTKIGRDPKCDVPIASYRNLGPVHAVISRFGRDLVIESISGSLSVNEEKSPTGKLTLKYDDVIACGSLRFMLRRE